MSALIPVVDSAATLASMSLSSFICVPYLSAKNLATFYLSYSKAFLDRMVDVDLTPR